MARPPQVRPEELTPDTPGRIKLVTWPDYQKNLGNEDARLYVFVTIFRPTDTILYASIEARLLWWELIRLSGAGRNKGCVVLGKNDPITPRQVADIIHLDLKTVVMPGLIENVKAGRIIINSAEPSVNSEKPKINSDNEIQFTETSIKSKEPHFNSQKPPNNSDDESQVLTTPGLHMCISKEKRSKEKGEGSTPSFSDFSQKEKKDAVEVFLSAWQELHCKRWETPDEYLPTGFEKRDMHGLLTPGNLETYIAYAYHYHHNNGVGIKPGEQAPTIDRFLNKEAPKYCSTLREGMEEWVQATEYAREYLAEIRSRQ